MGLQSVVKGVSDGGLVSKNVSDCAFYAFQALFYDFMGSELDVLAVGNYLFPKEEQDKYLIPLWLAL